MNEQQENTDEEQVKTQVPTLSIGKSFCIIVQRWRKEKKGGREFIEFTHMNVVIL